MMSTKFLAHTKARLVAGPEARFAISLDRLANAIDTRPDRPYRLLGGRCGNLAVVVRDAGGFLYDFEPDAWAREVTERIGLGTEDSSLA